MKISAANLSRLMAAAVLLAALATPAATAVAATSPRDADALAKSTYIYIATVRKDGNQSRAVPVWFIPTGDNQVLIETSPTSWKAKRIRRGSPALIWIGSPTGPAFIGKAEIVEDKALQDAGDRGLSQKIPARANRLCASHSRQTGFRPDRCDSNFAGARSARRISVRAWNAGARP